MKGLQGLAITIAAMMPLLPLAVQAQELPKAFAGVWKNMEGKTAECSHSDWNSPKQDDTHILVSAKEVNFHEGWCKLKALKTNPSGAVRVRMSCSSEGGNYEREEIWRATEVRGVSMLIVTSPDAQRFHTQVYQWCPR